jgi:hypothetical protein
MKNFIYKTCVPKDQEAVTNLYFATKEALCLPNKAAAQKVTDLLFAKGHVIGGYHGDVLGGALGYFLGEPQYAYTNKEVLFLYVGAILPQYQLTRMFHQGLLFALQIHKGGRVKEIRLQAKADNLYTNKLYGRFAQPIAKEKSPRGVPVITYGGSIDDAIAYLTRGKRKSVHDLLTAVS